jgi:hypothetical protein
MCSINREKTLRSKIWLIEWRFLTYLEEKSIGLGSLELVRLFPMQLRANLSNLRKVSKKSIKILRIIGFMTKEA